MKGYQRPLFHVRWSPGGLTWRLGGPRGANPKTHVAMSSQRGLYVGDEANGILREDEGAPHAKPPGRFETHGHHQRAN